MEAFGVLILPVTGRSLLLYLVFSSGVCLLTLVWDCWWTLLCLVTVGRIYERQKLQQARETLSPAPLAPVYPEAWRLGPKATTRPHISLPNHEHKRQRSPREEVDSVSVWWIKGKRNERHWWTGLKPMNFAHVALAMKATQLDCRAVQVIAM